ncbi:MAG: hypothetical protein JNM18_19790 [Planctomycetaceae bacterium]|nr:hypothetical protein [Planctomycetaceae bacterium]
MKTLPNVLPPLEWFAALVAAQSGPESHYDGPSTAFLLEQQKQLLEQEQREHRLVRTISLGRVPWLYVAELRTRSLGRTTSGEIVDVDRHVLAIRYLPDFLRRVNRWETLKYVAPLDPAPFHPNICPETGAVCLEVYPGQMITQVLLNLHELLRYRLRQTDERDALNHEACRYVRNHVFQPLDERPLFGRSLDIRLQRLE